MKYLINIIATMFFCWPAMAAGYVFQCLKTGFIAGAYLAEKHGDEILDKIKSTTP